MTRYALVLLLLVAAPLAAQGRGQENADIPQGHRPPPGMCRIWIDGVPPARQPAPTDCATAIRRRPPNARVVFGDELRATQNLRDDHGDRAPAEPLPVERQPADRRTADPRPVEPPPPPKAEDRGRAKPKNGKPGRPQAELPPPGADEPGRSFRAEAR